MRTCDTYRSQTIPVQAFLEGNITQLNGTHHKSAQGVHLMRKCYDRAKVTPPPARFPSLAESLGVEPASGACEACARLPAPRAGCGVWVDGWEVGMAGWGGDGADR